MFYKLHYFKKSSGICGSDFKNETQIDTINLSLVSSLSDLQKFKLPFSNTYVGNFAILTMSNGEKYYLDEESFSDLSDAISKTQWATSRS